MNHMEVSEEVRRCPAYAIFDWTWIRMEENFEDGVEKDFYLGYLKNMVERYPVLAEELERRMAESVVSENA